MSDPAIAVKLAAWRKTKETEWATEGSKLRRKHCTREAFDSWLDKQCATSLKRKQERDAAETTAAVPPDDVKSRAPAPQEQPTAADCASLSTSMESAAPAAPESLQVSQKKSSRRRRKKKAEQADDDKIVAIGETLADMSLKQEKMKQLYKKHGVLQEQFNTLTSRTPNTARGHTMLYDRRKKLIDEMEALLKTIGALNTAMPGAGSVDELKTLEAIYSEAALSGEQGAASSLEEQLNTLQADSIEKRQLAQRVAARAREQRLARQAAAATAKQTKEIKSLLANSNK